MFGATITRVGSNESWRRAAPADSRSLITHGPLAARRPTFELSGRASGRRPLAKVRLDALVSFAIGRLSKLPSYSFNDYQHGCLESASHSIRNFLTKFSV